MTRFFDAFETHLTSESYAVQQWVKSGTQNIQKCLKIQDACETEMTRLWDDPDRDAKYVAWRDSQDLLSSHRRRGEMDWDETMRQIRLASHNCRLALQKLGHK
jgi:hypothetical protein